MNSTLYHIRGLPVLQNRVYPSREAALACTQGELRLEQCPHSGLVFNAAFDQGLLSYDQHYDNEQAHSAHFQSHLEQVAQLIESHLGRNNLIEIGCGKGAFVELMLKRGVDIQGYDASYTGNNPRISKRHFDPSFSSQAPGLVLRHVLEHIPQPWDFLRMIRASNGNQGLIYIEVPSLDWILEHNAWFDLFYEHVNYFRAEDFTVMFSELEEQGTLFGGQYLYVVADLGKLLHSPKQPPVKVHFPETLTPSLELPPGNDSVIVWGASSKGVIFSLLQLRSGQKIDMVVDINPAKQDKFLPLSGLRVSSPEECLIRFTEGANIIVMNSNYLAEIREMTHNRYNYIGIDHV